MAGILNSKERVMDTLITAPGRAQAANGHMQFRYVTFTDRHSFYDREYTPTGSNIATDAGERIYFEAENRFQDLLCLETDLNGRISWQKKNFKVPNSLIQGIDGLYEYIVVSGSFPTGSIINSLVGGIPEEITKGLGTAYNQQHFLSTQDFFNPNSEFLLSTSSLDFNMTSHTPDSSWVSPNMSIEELPPAYRDWRFSHRPNFQFLPPINKLPPGARMERVLPFIVTNLDLPNIRFETAVDIIKVFSKEGALPIWDVSAENPGFVSSPGSLGEVPWQVSNMVDSTTWTFNSAPGQIATIISVIDSLTPEDFAAARLSFMGLYSKLLMPDLNERPVNLMDLWLQLKQKGGNALAPVNIEGLTFTETSNNNNCIIQIFEFPEGTNKVNKLTIIDAGEIGDFSPYGPNHRLFYVGKLYDRVPKPNAQTQPSFANIFTIVAHSTIDERGYTSDIFKTIRQQDKNAPPSAVV